MEMLSGGGLFAPRARDDGTFAFASPVGEGYVSMIALDDLAFYVDWIFENPTKSVGIDLKVSTEDVYWDDLVKTFTAVTGAKAVNLKLSQEQYFVFRPPHTTVFLQVV